MIHVLCFVAHMCKNTHLTPMLGVSNWSYNLNLDLILYIHPYFVYTSSEGFDVSANVCRRYRVVVGRQCNKYLSILGLIGSCKGGTSYMRN